MSILSACSDEDQGKTASHQLALTAWDVNRTHTQAEAQALNIAKDMLDEQSSGVKSCLASEGVNSGTLTAECETSPVQVLYTSPYPVVSGVQVGGRCYWRCKVEVPSEGVVYDGLLILKELQTTTETSGGC